MVGPHPKGRTRRMYRVGRPQMTCGDEPDASAAGFSLLLTIVKAAVVPPPTQRRRNAPFVKRGGE